MEFKSHSYIHRGDGGTTNSWHSYVCGHCKKFVTGLVAGAFDKPDGPIKWLLCPSCVDGSVLTRNGVLYPFEIFGPEIQGVPQDTNQAYDEARTCFSVKAYTACELLCRKILMHVAVDKGAQAGDNFEKYINYLETLGYITPPMKKWVDLIRTNGNQATHELSNPDKKYAEGTLMFTAELPRLIYEMEYISNQYTST